MSMSGLYCCQHQHSSCVKRGHKPNHVSRAWITSFQINLVSPDPILLHLFRRMLWRMCGLRNFTYLTIHIGISWGVDNDLTWLFSWPVPLKPHHDTWDLYLRQRCMRKPNSTKFQFLHNVDLRWKSHIPIIPVTLEPHACFDFIMRQQVKYKLTWNDRLHNGKWRDMYHQEKHVEWNATGSGW